MRTQRSPGTLQVWAEPFVQLRVPTPSNLRTDPFEQTDITSSTYWEWVLHNDFLVPAASRLVTRFLPAFIEFPPRQRAASFTIDRAVEKMEATLTSGQ